MNRIRLALLALALVLTFAARTPQAGAACVVPCSGPDGSYVLLAMGCCSIQGHPLTSYQQYARWVCTAGCAHPTNPKTFICATTEACQPL
jgi:hypothetical protein